ncbi:PcfK-like family protein [Phocaeicola sartorii JCM 17136 = DSM 21941]
MYNNLKRTYMKGTEQFKAIIKNYLDNRAKEDELFRAKYETTTRTIDDIVNYIFSEVQKSGCYGFADEEIYSMAVHVVDEPTLEIGKPASCNVVVNHHIDLTEEEKAEQRDIALKRYQEEELRKLQVRNSRPKPSKPKVPQQAELSLFDF